MSSVLHVSAPPGNPLHKRAGVHAWNFENDRYKIKSYPCGSGNDQPVKTSVYILFCLFQCFPSLLKRIHTNMRALTRLHCTGRKGRPEWVFRSVMKTPINSLRNDSFRINFTLVIMWQPVWTRSCTKLIRISCKRPLKVFIPRASRFACLSEY